jgi:hypothetical protein
VYYAKHEKDDVKRFDKLFTTLWGANGTPGVIFTIGKTTVFTMLFIFASKNLNIEFKKHIRTTAM